MNLLATLRKPPQKRRRWIYSYRWEAFLGAIIIYSILWLFLYLSSRYKWGHFLRDDGNVLSPQSFQTYLGILLGFLSCIIGIIVWIEVRSNEATTLDEFLELLTQILKSAEKDEVVLIVAPTFFIGGSVESYCHLDYIAAIQVALKKEVKVRFAMIQFDSALASEYIAIDKANFQGRDSLLSSAKFTSDSLITFHNAIVTVSNRSDVVTRAEYFEKMFTFAEKLFHVNAFKPTYLNSEYDNVKIVGVASERQKRAIIGVYELQSGIKLGGNLVTNMPAVQSIRGMLKLIVELHNVNKAFDIAAYLS
jgi:hypothetical protein